MQDYKPNSNRFKQEQKEAATEREKLAPVVQGARVKEDSEIVKAARSAKSHAWSEILMPMFKDLLWKLITDTADILIFRNESRRTTSSSTPYVSYDKSYRAPSSSSVSRVGDSQTEKKRDYRDLVFRSYADADKVLKMMQNVIDQYEVVRIADIYDVAGVSADFGSHTDINYGWTDIHTATVEKIRDANGFGYILKLPRALPIEK